LAAFKRKQLVRLAGAGAVASLLVLAACTEVTLEDAPAKSAPSAVQPSPQEVLRTDQVFDKEKYKNQLTIRYFYLEGPEMTGDSILIQSPDGKSMLIDSGLPGVGAQVVSYLDKLGVAKLDIALNTHPHTDHIGGFATVAQKKEIGVFYMENLPYPSSASYRNAIAALDAKQVPKEILEEGSTFKLGEEVSFEVLSPPKGELPGAIKTFSAPELNDYSMVLRMTFRGQSYLITGDIYKHREMELVGSALAEKLDADSLHVPHHGSESTSSSELFMQAVTPKYAVMSQNLFQSPNLMERYQKKGAQVFSTGLHGNVLLILDGKDIRTITEKDWAPRSGAAQK
jgi:competence protein ComEC